MKRKINLVGTNTLTVSLPRKWVDSYHIKKGDEIELIEDGPKLLLNSRPGVGPEKKLNLDIRDLDRTSILIAVRGAYRAGYNEIHIKFDKQYVLHHRTSEQIKLLSIIHAAVNLLIGAEIISQDESGCLIKDFSSNLQTELNPTIRRIFLLLMESTSDFLIGLEKGDAFLISSMEEKHNTISKFISYCIRMINTGVTYEHKRQETVYHILLSLDNIMEVYRSCARDFIEFNTPKVSSEALSLVRGISACLRLFYELFYSFDNKKCSEFILQKSNIKTQIMRRRKHFKSEELLLIHYLSHNLDLIWDLVLAVKSDTLR